MPLSRRSMLHAALAALGAGGLSFGAQAQPAELNGRLAGARLQGQGRLTYFGLHVYDAKLWVPDGFKADDPLHTPLALELIYARELVGQRIAERSLAEMKKVGEVMADQSEPWLAAMAKTFPDVKKGDRLSGLYEPGTGMRFFFNGTACGDVRDPAFARRFIDIWLSPRTSEPALRLALLGQAR